MAQYKVPQDVEADDKLIGPFSFRQFVYLLIAGGLIGIGVGLFQVFPLLVLIPLPPVLLLLALALPLKKDQPMETYLAAFVSYYLKPHKRFWMPGQRDTTILITAPKIVEEVRTRDISEEEATHRLSFLADIVDSGGQAIKGANSSPMREDLYAEASAAVDMFDSYQSQVIERAVNQDKIERHNDAIKEMREAIEKNDEFLYGTLANNKLKPTNRREDLGKPVALEKNESVETVEEPEIAEEVKVSEEVKAVEEPEMTEELKIIKPEVDLPNSENLVEKYKDVIIMPGKDNTSEINSSIIDLANNPVLSVATIAKEANRLKEKGKGEVFISLH